MSYFCNLAVDGALNGASYALVALAFVLVYKASSMMNFAVGEWTTLGALLAGTGLFVLQLGVVAAIAFAGLAMFAFAAGFYRLVVRRLVARPAISGLMATLGLGMAIRGIGLLLFAGAPTISFALAPIDIAGAVVAAEKIAAATVAGVCIALIGGFYRFSRAGVALRAIADDPEAAMAAGIDIDRHLLMVWGTTGAVSTAAGLVWALTTGGGFGLGLIGLKVFPIVILGGLDSIAGTVVAALALGIVESLASGYLDESLGSGFGGIVPYLCLLAMLVWRPHGLFGQSRVERV